MNRDTQAVTDDPEATVCFALVNAIVEEAVFAILAGVQDVCVFPGNGFVRFVVFGEGQVVATGRAGAAYSSPSQTVPMLPSASR